MTDTVRCPACRGAKKVPKLGGMIGECNTCKGKGNILAIDKPTKVVAEPVTVVNDVVNAVADSLPASAVQHKADITTLPDVKIDGKKAIYKRKRA